MHLPDPITQPQFYASVPTKRLLAWVVDMAIVLAMCLLIVPFTAFIALWFFPALMVVIGFAYRVVTIANGSATWGMRLMAIEFRNQNGERFDLGLAVMHTTGTYFSFAFAIVQIISIVLMLTTDRKQGLTDLALGTTALNRRSTL